MIYVRVMSEGYHPIGLFVTYGFVVPRVKSNTPAKESQLRPEWPNKNIVYQHIEAETTLP